MLPKGEAPFHGTSRVAPRGMRTRFVIVVVGLLVVMLAASGCKRPCQSEKNCKRSCDCIDKTNGGSQKCTLAFLCQAPEGNGEKVCEDDYDALSCDEMCSKFAAAAQCGTSRCEADANCDRKMQCAVVNDAGEPTGLFQNCEIPFVCDATNKVCPAAFNRRDAELCATCCTTPGQPCQ